MNRARGSTCSRSPGRQKKRHRSSKPVGRARRAPSVTCGRPASGRKLVNAPSARSTASRSILPRSAASTIGGGSAGGCSSLKPVDVRSPENAASQEVERVRDLGQRLRERHLVPALDDPVRRGADPEHEPAVAGVGQRGRLLGQQRRPPREHADHAGAEPDPLGPGRRQRQRREAVRPLRLAAPQVGVAGRLGARGRARRARAAAGWEAAASGPSVASDATLVHGVPGHSRAIALALG